MSTHDLLKELRKKGFDLIAVGDRLRVRPKGLITPHFRGMLTEHRRDIMKALALETLSLTSFPPQHFEDAQHCIEVALPWLPQTLWFVPDIGHANVLVKDGVGRGRIWTAHEVRELWELPDLTPDRVQAIARIKYGFDIGIGTFEIEPKVDGPARGRGEVFTCYCCHGTRFWKSRNGVPVCQTCHPAPDPGAVVAWIEDGVERAVDPAVPDSKDA